MTTNKLPALAAAAIISISAFASAKPATLDWFAGHWCSDRNGEFIEETWLAPRGDLLLGMSRTVKGAKTASFEFLRIEWTAGIPTYIAQPQGHPPVPFKWTAGGTDWARFENSANDFPKRVEYRRTKEGLYAEIAGPGDADKDLVIPFNYHACPN
ncbi:MAG: DUF6265 family protein [Pseudomonadota bacterium]